MRPRRLLALLALAAAGVALVRRRRSRAPAVEPPAPPVAPLPPGPRFLSIPWELAAPAGGEDAELTVRFARSEGMALDRVDVRETPTQVFLTVLVRAEPGPEVGERVEETATVALAAPLGDRDLVPGATDAVYP